MTALAVATGTFFLWRGTGLMFFVLFLIAMAIDSLFAGLR